MYNAFTSGAIVHEVPTSHIVAMTCSGAINTVGTRFESPSFKMFLWNTECFALAQSMHALHIDTPPFESKRSPHHSISATRMKMGECILSLHETRFEAYSAASIDDD
jgi:hypothetical protein